MRSREVKHLVRLFSTARRPVFITGAGLSASSGLPTYRGEGGIFDDPVAPCLPLEADDRLHRLDDVVAYIASVAAASDAASPSAAHHAIAAYQRACTAQGGNATVTTMNVDDLHERSGAVAHHLHGRAHWARCDHCEHTFGARLTHCDRCGRPATPDVVLYGERLDPLASWETKRALRDPDLLAVIGVSGSSAQVHRWVRYATLDQGIPTVLITKAPEPTFASLFTEVLDADVSILPTLLSVELASA